MPSSVLTLYGNRFLLGAAILTRARCVSDESGLIPCYTGVLTLCLVLSACQVQSRLNNSAIPTILTRARCVQR